MGNNLGQDERPFTRKSAVRTTMAAILRNGNRQEVQDALRNDAWMVTWVYWNGGGDEVSEIHVYESIIREAEDRLGARLPKHYKAQALGD